MHDLKYAINLTLNLKSCPSSCIHSRIGCHISGTSHIWSVCFFFNMIFYYIVFQQPSTVLWRHFRHHLSTGLVYFKDCPQQPNIPNYLLGLALVPLLLIPFVTFACESNAAQRQQHPGGFKSCLGCLISLFTFTWILAGKEENIT